MTNASSSLSRQRSLRKFILHPSTLAAISSVGVHVLIGVLLFLLPTRSTTADESSRLQDVDVVTLTPEELARVPDLSAPNFTLPSFPSTSDFEAFPGIESEEFDWQPIEPSDDFRLNTPQSPYFPSFNVPSIPAIPAAPPRWSLRDLEEFYRDSPTPPAQVPDNNPASPTPSETPPEVQEQEQTEIEPSEETEVTPENSTVADAPISQETTQLPLDSSESTDVETNDAPPAPEESLLAEQQAIRELFIFSAELTRPDESNVAFGDWYYDELAQPDPPTEGQEITLYGEFPKVACPLQQSTSAIYGVELGDDRSLAAEPRPIQRSGYPYFDREALAVIESYDFTQLDSSYGVYLVEVLFEYDPDYCPMTVPSPEDQTG